MNLKPINSTSTLEKISNQLDARPQFVVRAAVSKNEDLSHKGVTDDPSGVLTGSIFSLIKSFKFKNIVVIIITILGICGAVGWGVANYFWINTGWFAYILPAILLIISLYLLVNSSIEYGALKRDVKKYRVDIQHGLTSTPPFLVRAYRLINLRQVSHNWYTFYVFFFGGLSLLVFYFLKDHNFWVFHFQWWINDAFKNVFLIEVLALCALLGTILIHFIMAIFRKRRIYQLDSYFGSTLLVNTNLVEEKAKLNKAYRRAFYFILLLILVVPLVALLITRLLKRK